jgi:hypothetical protein
MSVDSQRPPDRKLDSHDTASVNLREGLRLWVTANLARSWYNDAMSEVNGNLAAGGSTHRDRVRREILFAVCLAETYLFEWVRDSALNHDYEKLNHYFPPIERKRPKMPVRERWREVPKQLASDGLLTKLPRWTAEQDIAWKRLVDYRNGLVHARASQPDTKGLGNGENPIPGLDELDQLVKRGWALSVVIDRIRGLHQAAGTELPSWLQRPRVE